MSPRGRQRSPSTDTPPAIEPPAKRARQVVAASDSVRARGVAKPLGQAEAQRRIAELHTPEGRTLLRRRLWAWFGRHARQLPWRQSRDPYAIWVSEIMLQQTQVATVSSYFPRFLDRFPTVEALARAEESEVLRLWEGLGYYRRARQLHAAAKRVVAEHAGRFPSEREAVRSLPGIGRYTAGAILSIAFDQPEPILEANTVRLVSRLLAYRGEVRSAAGREPLWAAAEAWLPRRGAGDFNQALMELGSLVCTPRQPDCPRCPLVELCATQAGGWQDTIPAAAPPPRWEDVREASVAVLHRGRVLLVRRAHAPRWAGLWDFPRFPITHHEGPHGEFLAAGMTALTGLEVSVHDRLTTFRHGVTRFRITLDCYLARYLRRETAPPEATDLAWVGPAELEHHPLSSPGRRLARQLVRRGFAAPREASETPS